MTEKKYLNFIKILTSDTKYSNAFAEVVDSSLHEKISSSLINISYEMGCSLNIIRDLIDTEFRKKD